VEHPQKDENLQNRGPISDIDLLLRHPRTTSHTQPKDHRPFGSSLLTKEHQMLD
jgi:hypothetical protein